MVEINCQNGKILKKYKTVMKRCSNEFTNHKFFESVHDVKVLKCHFCNEEFNEKLCLQEMREFIQVKNPDHANISRNNSDNCKTCKKRLIGKKVL